MRTYGRTYDVNGNPTWKVVTTDANGYNDEVYTTTLVQCSLLNLGESPFHANYGIPARQSIITQIAPDFYLQQLQRQFAPFFASLIIFPTPAARPFAQTPAPTYRINIITHSGSIMPPITIPTSIPT